MFLYFLQLLVEIIEFLSQLIFRFPIDSFSSAMHFNLFLQFECQIVVFIDEGQHTVPQNINPLHNILSLESTVIQLIKLSSDIDSHLLQFLDFIAYFQNGFQSTLYN